MTAYLQCVLRESRWTAGRGGAMARPVAQGAPGRETHGAEIARALMLVRSAVTAAWVFRRGPERVALHELNARRRALTARRAYLPVAEHSLSTGEIPRSRSPCHSRCALFLRDRGERHVFMLTSHAAWPDSRRNGRVGPSRHLARADSSQAGGRTLPSALAQDTTGGSCRASARPPTSSPPDVACTVSHPPASPRSPGPPVGPSPGQPPAT